MIHKIAHYLIRNKPDADHIFQQVSLDPPPCPSPNVSQDSETALLTAYMAELLEGFLLPTGDEQLLIQMKPEGYVSPIDKWHPSEIIYQYILEGSPPFSPLDYPEWLKDIQPTGQIDRWLLIGDPTLYGHLVPIQPHFSC